MQQRRKTETYIIIGGLGHLGLTIAKELWAKGKNVIIFDVQIPEKHHDLNGIDYHYGDITKFKDLDLFFKTLEKPVYVVHCASIVSIVTNPGPKLFEVNVSGTKNIVRICFKYKVKRLVYVSTVHVLEEQKKGIVIKEQDFFVESKVKGHYAKTKARATQIVLDSTKKGLDAIVLHPSGIIGPNDFNVGHTTRLIIDYLNGDLRAAINGGYDFVDVRDVALGVISALRYGKKGHCYILSNQFFTLRYLLETLSKLTAQKPIKAYLPMWFIVPLAPVAEFYYKVRKVKPLFTPYSLYTLKSNAYFSHEKATEELNYFPRPLEQTLSDTIDWLWTHGFIKHAKF